MPEPVAMPEEVATALSRVRTRWAQLPLERAESSMPQVARACAALLAPGAQPPELLGPSAAMDQVTVLIYDACCGASGAARFTSAQTTTLLTDLLRDLA